MTAKERLLIALDNQKPDRVPATPDISNMIPCRLTGKPFWDIYLYNDPPLHRAYLEAVKYLGIDGWDCYVPLDTTSHDTKEIIKKVIHQDEEKIVVRTTYRTPDKDLFEEMIYRSGFTPATSSRLIKKLPEDFEVFIKYFFPDPSDANDTEYMKWKAEFGDLGISSPGAIYYPGFHYLVEIFDGALEQVAYAYYDYPELFEKYREVSDDYVVKLVARALVSKPDYLLFGCSGSLTLQSLDIFRHLSLPTLKTTTRMAKEAGTPTMVHSCGKEKDLVKLCVEETDLSCINPLEVPPMGDCNLADIKNEFGERISLMGNLHTTEVMLQGSVQDVIAASKKAIDDAAANGGFILSTGDQCGRDTPYENIFAMVETASNYGKYKS